MVVNSMEFGELTGEREIEKNSEKILVDHKSVPFWTWTFAFFSHFQAIKFYMSHEKKTTFMSRSYFFIFFFFPFLPYPFVVRAFVSVGFIWSLFICMHAIVPVFRASMCASTFWLNGNSSENYQVSTLGHRTHKPNAKPPGTKQQKMPHSLYVNTAEYFIPMK